MRITEKKLKHLITKILNEGEEFSDFTGNYEEMSDESSNKNKVVDSFSKAFGIAYNNAEEAIDEAMRKIFPDPNDRKTAYTSLAITVPPLVAGAAAFFYSATGRAIYRAIMIGEAGMIAPMAFVWLWWAGPRMLWQLLNNLGKIETTLVTLRRLTPDDSPIKKKHIKTKRRKGEYKGLTGKDYTYQEMVTILAAQNVQALSREANYGTGKNMAQQLFERDVISEEMYKDIFTMTYSIREDINNRKKKLKDLEKTVQDLEAPYGSLAMTFISNLDPTGTASKAITTWDSLS